MNFKKVWPRWTPHGRLSLYEQSFIIIRGFVARGKILSGQSTFMIVIEGDLAPTNQNAQSAMAMDPFPRKNLKMRDTAKSAQPLSMQHSLQELLQNALPWSLHCSIVMRTLASSYIWYIAHNAQQTLGPWVSRSTTAIPSGVWIREPRAQHTLSIILLPEKYLSTIFESVNDFFCTATSAGNQNADPSQEFTFQDW